MKLCHDITAMYEGFKGAKYKRGHIIEEKDKFGFKKIFFSSRDINFNNI